MKPSFKIYIGIFLFRIFSFKIYPKLGISNEVEYNNETNILIALEIRTVFVLPQVMSSSTE